MPITAHPEVDAILSRLLTELRQILDRNLVGLYLTGSLVTGDFDLDISDIDLVAAIRSDLDDRQFDRLQEMHERLARSYPAWDDRIEIAYISLPALATFRFQPSRIAIISPGEPFHFKEAGADWTINWWVLRNLGVTLFGPAPTTIVGPIDQAVFLDAVRAQVRAWGNYITHTRQSRAYQGYAILTLCRALYALTNGAQVSKRRAAIWAADRFPAWSSLIRDALVWRANPHDPAADPDATFPQAVRFVQFAIDQVARS